MAESVTRCNDSQTATLPVVVAYVPPRLSDEIARHIDRLTQVGKPFTLIIVYDGEKFSIWEGRKAGIVR